MAQRMITDSIGNIVVSDFMLPVMPSRNEFMSNYRKGMINWAGSAEHVGTKVVHTEGTVLYESGEWTAFK